MTADRLAPADVDALARMHREALPGSLVSLLGPAYARSFYQYVATSSAERVWLDRDDRGGLQAACVVSLAPATLARRLARATPLARAMLRALPRLPVRALARGATRRAPRRQGPGPEILLIFAEAATRSRGRGRALLARVEADLAGGPDATLWVKTRDEAGNRAIAFYERAGFASVASIDSLGKRLRLLAKPLPPARTP